jgi:uncharacterized cupredoxin-like copper-binding protein
MLFGAALALAGCAGSRQQVAEVRVTMTEFGFTPAELAVTAGQPVRLLLTNDGTLEHDLSIMEFPMETSSSEVGAGESTGHVMEMTMDPELHMSALAGESATLEFTPTVPGTYEFFCTVAGHREAGMTGTLSVVAP